MQFHILIPPEPARKGAYASCVLRYAAFQKKEEEKKASVQSLLGSFLAMMTYEDIEAFLGLCYR